MTLRVRNILEALWESTSKPVEGWIWEAPTASGHVESSSLKKQHSKTFKTLAEQAAECNEKPSAPIRALYAAAHIPHTPGSIRLQRLDVGSYCGPQFNRHVRSLRPSE